LNNTRGKEPAVLSLIVPIQTALLAWSSRLRRDRGQATAEYALVLLGAAAVAMLVFAWASDSNRISELLDAIVDFLISKVP
jgi:hypothetical protein